VVLIRFALHQHLADKVHKQCTNREINLFSVSVPAAAVGTGHKVGNSFSEAEFSLAAVVQGRSRRARKIVLAKNRKTQ
jgi:hypothetical protein